MSLAPIVLFVYNRPQHTLKTLEALMQNELAEMSELFIFCDGPKPNAIKADLDKIDAVHTLILKKQWCKKVSIKKAEVNKGLADSIVEGVTEIVNKYGKIIVLEDDIVTSKGFLRYMNEALDLYENEPKVMQISGFMVPSKVELEQTGLFRCPASWGWATWNSSWKYYNHNTSELVSKITKEDINTFNLDDNYHYYDQLVDNDSGKLKTWAVRWYASIYFQRGLCLYPKKALIKNIGFGTGATNTSSSVIESYVFNKKNLLATLSLNKIAVIHESESYASAFKSFYAYQNYLWSKPSMQERLLSIINRIWNLFR